jgi:integrase
MQSSQVCGLISKLKQKAAKAGLDISDFHIHRARATFGTNMMVAGLKLVPNIQVSSVIAFVRDIMLHKDEAVTMTYVRFVESRKVKSAFADGYTKMLIGTFLEAA